PAGSKGAPGEWSAQSIADVGNKPVLRVGKSPDPRREIRTSQRRSRRYALPEKLFHRTVAGARGMIAPERFWLRSISRGHRLLGRSGFQRRQLNWNPEVSSKARRGVSAKVWLPPTPPLRCDTLPEAIPMEWVPTRSRACAHASVTRGTVAGRMPMRNFLLTTCMGVVAVFATGAAHANDELIRMSQNPKDWVMPAGDYANQRYSKLKQITPANVGKLQVAWTFSTGVLRGHEGGPLVIGDVMYVHGPFPNPVYALDLNNEAKILWKYEPKQDPNVIPVMCCDTVNRGLAYADGKIFLHQADTTLVALDAKDGKVVWQQKNGDPAKGETGTSAPMVIKDKVLIGISGGEFGVQCHVTAYDLKTGRRAWRAYSEGPDDQILVDPVKTTDLGKPVGKDSSIKTWQGDQWKIGGGCTLGWISYDPQLNLSYYGSGNPSTWNPSQRPGDNKWSMTIFARNPDTGMAKWVYQMTPHDEWDYDGVNEMILSDQQIGGQT